MATHRQTLVGLLATAVTGLASGGTVKRSPATPQSRSGPLVLVWAGDEAVDIAAKGGVQARVLDLHVTALADGAAAEALDAAVETMAGEIETAVLADASLLAAVQSLDLVRIVKETDDSGQTIAGAARLTFQAEYRTRAGAPDTAV